MAIEFTEKQKKVLNARNHNVLVSAAAGSGKTAVLVERIVRMISEGEHPLDIDRLLVVTFTRAAAAQMRERIARAVSARLEANPGDRHLQRQETLLHHAQITTIDSFCTFLLRNNFSEIDLDPGFRQMDDTQNVLLKKDVMKRFLEEKFEEKEPDFAACVEYFCPAKDSEHLEDLIRMLYEAADSHPYPEVWLEERREDYHVESEEELFQSPWYGEILREEAANLPELSMLHEAMVRIAGLPDGPFPYLELLEKEESELFGKLDALAKEAENETDRKRLRERLLEVSSYSLAKLPVIRGAEKQGINEERKSDVQELRKQLKKRLDTLHDHIEEDPSLTVYEMQRAEKPLSTLISLTIGYRRLLQKVKKEKNVIDFSDLEHMALEILLERRGDGSFVLRKAAEGYRNYFDEILIDEYQDSNEVQELLLSAIAGERGGEGCRYARFMVGDVKQSIYRFRNARPEIFEEKFETYRQDDPQTERIDLDQNFRSRQEVLDAANAVFTKLMRREIGGVDYDETVSLKVGAHYPRSENVYQTELLLVDGAPGDAGDADSGTSDSGNFDSGNSDSGDFRSEDGGENEAEEEIAMLPSARKEALAVAQRIREIVGILPVTDEETGELRPARFGDIVILLRSTSGKQDAFREIFEKEGIPLYLEYKGGYFAAEEVRAVLQALRVIDNPRQDIPLYGVLRGYFGGFTLDEIGSLRSLYPREDDQNEQKNSWENKLLYDCVLAAAGDPAPEEAGSAAAMEVSPVLREHCRQFLSWLSGYREKMASTPIHELISELIRSTGYENYVRALPAGARRAANLHSLLVKAEAFEQGDYAGLFRFLRYIDQMHEYNVDYGEANVLDENADVVRLTTIHKSKGLEYPICFVCGLGARHPFSRDVRGDLITDTDAGLGVSFVVPELRSSRQTLRQKAVASKITRDALGEELRVLYVAMTRAKEKLILTGFVRDGARAEKKVAMDMASVSLPVKHLPASLIRSASGFLPLILDSMEALKAEGEEPIRLRKVAISDLRLSEVENQAAQGELLRTLQLMEDGGAEVLPDPALAGTLKKRFSYRYPHENLKGLYTKTTVTELKRAAMLEESELIQPGEGADSLFPEKNRQSGRALTGSARGTAIHCMCEKINYHVWREPGEVTAAEFESRVSQLLADGTIPKEYAGVLTPAVFLPFLSSGIAARMAGADQKGLLQREQPFVLGIAANRLNPEFPAEETILIQGIIDAFLIEGEGADRHVVIVDYKTDHVKYAEQLSERYQVQLNYYAEALSKMLQLPVTEKMIYSFHLQKEIRVK